MDRDAPNRLPLAAVDTQGSNTTVPSELTATRLPHRRARGPLLLCAAAFSLGGAAVYLALLPALLQTDLLDGLLFTATGIIQVTLAIALLASPTRRRLATALAVSLAVVAIWVLARTTGLPGPNPWLPLDTTVGVTDVLCAALETLAVVLLGWAALRWPRGPRVHHPALVALASALPLLLAVLLTVGGVALATDGFTTVTRPGGPVPERLPAGQMTTVSYCTQHGTKLAMDLYAPPPGTARPAPVALYVHGGGFVLGNRNPHGLLANPAGALFPQLRAALNQRGIMVASIDYRLPPLSPWPAPLEDAKCAVRFLRAHASALGIDPGRIGAWGSSAGGNLVALLGLVGPEAGLDNGQYVQQSSQVQAVVDMFGVGDLTDLGDADPFMRLAVRVALGNSTSARRAASPISYLDSTPDPQPGMQPARDDPPFLLLHGTNDHPRHSQDLARRLKTAGVPVRLVLVQGAAHGLNSPSQQPTPAQLTKLITNFFTHTLADG